MGVEVTISPVEKADIPAILEIESASQLEPWSELSFLEEIDRLHSYFYGARIHGGHAAAQDKIVGYICFWVVADEIQILNLAVHNHFRRRGIARRLLDFAIRVGYEKNAGRITLEVRKSNHPAFGLYRAFNFSITGERPNYYEVHREPAILMELDLEMQRQNCKRTLL